MTILALAFLSSLSAATPTTPMPWFNNDDYPDEAFIRKQQGTTVFDVVVAPTGRPVDCLVTQSSGTALLDRRACQVAMRAARFAAATAPDGSQAYGIYRSKVNWTLDPEQWTQMEVGPDVELSLNKLPDGSGQPIEVKYAYFVDAQGNPSSCRAITRAQSPELESLGCQQLLSKAVKAPLALRRDGTVAAVRTGWVRFTSGN